MASPEFSRETIPSRVTMKHVIASTHDEGTADDLGADSTLSSDPCEQSAPESAMPILVNKATQKSLRIQKPERRNKGADQIGKYIREELPDTTHYYDIWHVAKGLGKKIDKVAKQKDCGDIAEWKQSISNHMYWCAASTPDGNGDMIKAKWEILPLHIQDIHTSNNVLHSECGHGELEGERRDKLWIEPGKKKSCISNLLGGGEQPVLWLKQNKKALYKRYKKEAEESVVKPLKEALKSHFAPKKLIVTERYRFHNCKQEESQNVSGFSAALKRLASMCEFGEFMPQALRDRFVCGLRNTAIQEKLLAEDYSFQDALKIAINMEMAVKDIAEVNPKPRAENEPVHKIQKKYPPSKPNTYDNAKRNEETRPSDGGRTRRFKCLSCGYDNHRREECKFRNATCLSCGLYGHIAMSKPVGKVDDRESEVDEQGELFSNSLYKLGPNNGFIVSIVVQGQTLSMEIDTGASVTIISKETHTKYFSRIPLLPSTVKLHTYTGDKIDVCGKFNADVQYESQYATLPITVVGGAGPSLIGRDWLYKLKLEWNKIVKINSVANTATPTNHNLQALLGKYPDVFKTGLGTMQGITAKLELKDGAKPKFCKARSVPYALQPTVEEEYDRLEREGTNSTCKRCQGFVGQHQGYKGATGGSLRVLAHDWQLRTFPSISTSTLGHQT
ncbi:hypothetical protein QZH41_006532 [Actinostola sp. cb2023]|nr:hypothetical protein QZH41_006532 [Actinostola sp. cb2023]